MICKFFGATVRLKDLCKAAWTAHREYEGLRTLRGYDLVGSPHHVIRPLGMDRDINCVLALEYYPGEVSATPSARHPPRDPGHLFRRLTALAFFLATQHNRTANGGASTSTSTATTSTCRRGSRGRRSATGTSTS